MKKLIILLVAFASIVVVMAPASASASSPDDEAIPNACMSQGGRCPAKDEGFTSWCCNNLTCRGGRCGG